MFSGVFYFYLGNLFLLCFKASYPEIHMYQLDSSTELCSQPFPFSLLFKLILILPPHQSAQKQNKTKSSTMHSRISQQVLFNLPVSSALGFLRLCLSNLAWSSLCSLGRLSSCFFLLLPSHPASVISQNCLLVVHKIKRFFIYTVCKVNINECYTTDN